MAQLAPARQLLGEMFLKVNDPPKAKRKFEPPSRKSQARLRSLQGAAQAAQRTASRETISK